MKRTQKGFTLIELLVVIAIIGVLAAVVLASLNSAREKGNQAAVKSNLDSVRVQAELYYNDHSNAYGSAFTTSDCAAANTMFADPVIASAISSAKAAGSGTASCAIGTAVGATSGTAQTWAAQVQFKDASHYWCVDNSGKATTSNSATAFTIGGGASASASCS